MSAAEIPPPRTCGALIGHDRNMAAFEAALASGKMHHAWLLSGPRGVGKASFAHLAAAAVLGRIGSIHAVAGTPAQERIAGGNEPRLHMLVRELNDSTGKLRPQIRVEQVRTLQHILSLSAEQDEWRCILIDAAEEMNAAAANAILKLLEEPPARVVFLLVSHAPGRLLPTIRSRCRRLEFHELSEAEILSVCDTLRVDPPPHDALAAARGSAGTALELGAGPGREISALLDEVLAPLPRAADRSALHRLGDLLAAAQGTREFETLSRLLVGRVAAISTALAEGEAPPAAFLDPAHAGTPNAALWAESVQRIEETRQRALGLNLDVRQAILDMVRCLEDTVHRMRV